MSAPPLTWVLEGEVFAEGDPLEAAARDAGHAVLTWADDWWESGRFPRPEGPVLFHGSLGNADRIRRELPWAPGAFCATERFACDAWYERASRWLLHERWEILPASRLVADAEAVLERLGPDALFVRPVSALKPFAGRVLRRGEISLAALDHGFYHDDPDLPVVVAPVRTVGREWRFVVVDGAVVTGSGYEPDGRRAGAVVVGGEPWRLAARIAGELAPPEPVYVLDLCESGGELRLLELNPLSGADLYGCDGAALVDAITRHLSGDWRSPEAAGAPTHAPTRVLSTPPDEHGDPQGRP